MDEPDHTDEKELGYCIEIHDALHYLITQHVKLLKSLLDPSFTKQRWALEAVKEKLKDQEKTPKRVPKAHFLKIDFPKEINNRIEIQVEEFKKVRGSYSKKKWVLDALYEMLDKEGTKIKRLLKNSSLDKDSSEISGEVSSVGRRLFCLLQNQVKQKQTK